MLWFKQYLEVDREILRGLFVSANTAYTDTSLQNSDVMAKTNEL